MKNIIQRNLSLQTKYILTDKKYIPLSEGTGCTCDNCNKLIANIATVKNDAGKSFNIGFDCLETVLINNQLLSGKDVAEYERIKKQIPKIIRAAKELKETFDQNNRIKINGLKFEVPTFAPYFPFWYLFEGCKPSNSYLKLKDVDFDFLIETLKNIFPRIEITIE